MFLVFSEELPQQCENFRILHSCSHPVQVELGWFQSLQKSYNRVTGRMANSLAEAIVDITKENLDPDAPIKIY